MALPSRGRAPRPAALAFAQRELADLRERYARGEVEVEELEDETRFWLKVEACEFCGHPGLCASHYQFMWDYGMQ